MKMGEHMEPVAELVNDLTNCRIALFVTASSMDLVTARLIIRLDLNNASRRIVRRENKEDE